jgi:pre-sodorifen synthase
MTDTSTASTPLVPFHVLRGPTVDPYQDRVARVYADPPDLWRQAIGDQLIFQFGVYDDPSGRRPISLDEAGFRYLDRQLELAGAASRTPFTRILDVGCGWGSTLRYLAERFPDCPRLDGVNVSREQLDHCGRLLAAHGLAARTNLFLCNARDLDLLPDPDTPYDLITVRGAITHFPYGVYESAVRALARRVRPGGAVVISENLYRTAPGAYRSAIPDTVDRLACRHHKSPGYLVSVLLEHGFAVRDMRILPSNADAVRWLQQARANIEALVPEARGALEELRVVADNLSTALRRDEVSVYSIIAELVA